VRRVRGQVQVQVQVQAQAQVQGGGARTSSCLPRVPLPSSKPTCLAAAHEAEPSRRPIATGMSEPISFSVSARFWACAGAWEPQPITPIFLMPSNALATSGNLSRPPCARRRRRG